MFFLLLKSDRYLSIHANIPPRVAEFAIHAILCLSVGLAKCLQIVLSRLYILFSQKTIRCFFFKKAIFLKKKFGSGSGNYERT